MECIDCFTEIETGDLCTDCSELAKKIRDNFAVYSYDVERVYRIQNKNGLFSAGKTRPNFTKVGKFFTETNLKRHLKIVKRLGENGTYADCDVVPYQLVEEKMKKISDFS